MKSLQRHLQLWLAVSLILLIVLFWIVANRSMHRITENYIVERLEHDWQNLYDALVQRNNQLALHNKRINSIYHTLDSGHYFLIASRGERLLQSKSLGNFQFGFKIRNSDKRHLFQMSGPQNQLLLVLVQEAQFNNDALTIAVAEDLSKIKHQRNQFKKIFTILAVFGLAGALIVQSIVVRRAMHRLDLVRDDIKRLEHSDAGTLSENVPSEILPVVQEFNQLLKLLETRLERSRHALADLSHALKTPLTIILQYFDTLQNKDPQNQQLIQVRQQTERIHQLIQRELKHARLAGGAVAKCRFNPAEELPELIAVIHQIHQQRSISINYDIDQTIKPFADQEDMLELIGNLLDNACKWAKSTVLCRIQKTPQITFVIEDDGECLSINKLDQLSQRGVRLDESVEGHGLGLAICKDIVTAYGGTISFDCSPGLGGLRVTVTLL